MTVRRSFAFALRLTLAVALAFQAGTAAAQDPASPSPADRMGPVDSIPETGAFTLTQNGTLIGTEEFTRAPGRLDTELRVLNQPTLTTTASLRPDATVGRLEVRVYPTGNPAGDPARTLAAVFGEGSVRLEQPIGESADEGEGGRPLAAGSVPYINPSPSYLEQLVRRATALGGSPVDVPVWSPAPGGGAVATATVTREDGSVTLDLSGVRILLEVDGDGRVVSGRVPAQGVVIQRR
jgi:hypothetical protein